MSVRFSINILYMLVHNWQAPHHKTMKTQWSILRTPLHIVLLSPVTEVQESRLFLNLDLQKASLHIENKLIKIAVEPLSTTGVVPDAFKKFPTVTPICEW